MVTCDLMNTLNFLDEKLKDYIEGTRRFSVLEHGEMFLEKFISQSSEIFLKFRPNYVGEGKMYLKIKKIMDMYLKKKNC